MKKFLISAVVVTAITIVAVLVVAVSDCQHPDPGPSPDVTVRPIESSPVATADVPDAGPWNVQAWVQSAKSGTVKAADGGKKLLELEGVEAELELQDGSRSSSFPDLEAELFGESGEAAAILDYDGSLGPVEVRLSDPKVEGGSASYVMEVLEGEQVLAKVENPSLRIKPVRVLELGDPVP